MKYDYLRRRMGEKGLMQCGFSMAIFHSYVSQYQSVQYTQVSSTFMQCGAPVPWRSVGANNSNFTRTYGRYIELVNGIANQFITAGAPPCGMWLYYATRSHFSYLESLCLEDLGLEMKLEGPLYKPMGFQAGVLVVNGFHRRGLEIWQDEIEATKHQPRSN